MPSCVVSDPPTQKEFSQKDEIIFKVNELRGLIRQHFKPSSEHLFADKSLCEAAFWVLNIKNEEEADEKV